METLIGAGLTATVALACTLVLAELVASTVMLVLVETAGAVNSPVLVIVPAEADQTTAVLLVPCTVALNCCVAPDTKLVLVGLTDSVIALVVVAPVPITICA